jgi:hypothetical protein
VFDSNQPRAMVLCQNTLDICCSSDEGADTFKSVTRGWMVKKS